MKLTPLAALLLSLVFPVAMLAQLPTEYHEKKVDLHPSDPPGLLVGTVQPESLSFLLTVDGQAPAKLAFLPPESMSDADKALALDAESAIAERAPRFGFDLSAGTWRYEQAACPAFPQHLILQYSRDDGRGGMTVFSAVIPRSGLSDSHVRIVPVERHGYSLFSPAPVNKITINDFNHIVKEESYQQAPDWLTLGLCYAAMAGGRPEASLQPTGIADERFPRVIPASLTLNKAKGASIEFADLTARVATGPKADKSLPQQWSLFFDNKGVLLKATRKPAATLQIGTAANAEDTKATPIKQTILDVHPSQ